MDHPFRSLLVVSHLNIYHLSITNQIFRYFSDVLHAHHFVIWRVQEGNWSSRNYLLKINFFQVYSVSLFYFLCKSIGNNSRNELWKHDHFADQLCRYLFERAERRIGYNVFYVFDYWIIFVLLDSPEAGHCSHWSSPKNDIFEPFRCQHFQNLNWIAHILHNSIDSNNP